MLVVEGNCDGMTNKPLEPIRAKPDQRVMLTNMDALIEPPKVARKGGMRGALAEYANPALAEREKGAWARAAAENFRKTGGSA